MHCHRTPLHCNALLRVGRDTVLCGQYELNEARKLREGRIDVFRVGGVGGATTAAALAPPLTHRATLQLADCGVFDMIGSSAQSPLPFGAHCAASCTDGTVKFISLGNGSDGCETTSATTDPPSVIRSVAMGDEMATSCCYFPRSQLLCTAHHKGIIAVRSLSQSGGDMPGRDHHQFQGHEFDAWVAAPALGDVDAMLFSGGDDAKLKLWDLRTLVADQEEGAESAPVCPVGAVSFGAGVVSVLPLSPFVVLVGTYAERVNAVDIRKLSAASRKTHASDSENPAVLSSVGVGGGAWRIRELSRVPVSAREVPRDEDGDEAGEAASSPLASGAAGDRFFAVAAMQAGAALVAMDAATHELRTASWGDAYRGVAGSANARGEFMHHVAHKADGSPDEPLIYDVAEIDDMMMVEGGARRRQLLLTASFYTNELCTWSI